MSEPLALQRRDQCLSAVIMLAIAAYGLLAASAYDLRLLALAGCYAIAVIGYQRLFGDLGVLSLAQGAFFAIGAYAVALLDTQGIVELALGVPLAVLAGTMLALLCSLPLLRLGSHYLALGSLAIAMLVLLGAVNLDRLTGGANGLPLQHVLTFVGIALSENLRLTVLAWLFVAIAAILYWSSASGIATLRRQMLRELPRAAAAIGLDRVRWQRGAFLFAAGLGAAAGALYAPVAGVVSPQVAELTLMVNLLAASVIGGRGRVSGALLGALLLVLLPEALRFAGNWYLLLWAVALLAMLIAAPQGIAGLLDPLLRLSIKPRWRASETPAPALATNADLALEDLHKSFGGVVAVDGVSLRVGRGEAVGIVGPNGAGKTTLLNLLCGIERADSGRILWRGADIRALPEWRRAVLGIGRSFQTSQLPLDCTTIDAVAVGAGASLPLPEARGQALALMQELGLGDHAHDDVAQLGPSQRRLVEIARAMMGQPALLVLDEPTAGMDRPQRDHLAALLHAWRQRGLALFLVEHDIGFVTAVCERLCCMESGRIVAEGAPVALRADPALRRFFGGVA